MHAAQDRPTELNPALASTPGAERPSMASGKSAAETVADSLTYLDLKPQEIIAFQTLLTRDNRFHEADVIEAARTLPVVRELLSRKTAPVAQLPEDLQDKRQELEVAGIQAALALIGRIDRSLAVDVLRIALAEPQERTVTRHDSLCSRLKQVYTTLLKTEGVPAIQILSSVRQGLATESNTDFLRGFLWPLMFAAEGDSLKGPLAIQSSSFQRIASAGISLEISTEAFLRSFCSLGTSSLQPMQSAANSELKLALKEDGGRHRSKYTRLLELIESSETFSAQDVLLIVESIKGKKEIELALPKLAVCEKINLNPNKEDVPAFAAIEIAYRAVNKLNASTLSHELHSRIFERVDKLIEELGLARKCSFLAFVGEYALLTAPAWGLAAVIPGTWFTWIAAGWTCITTIGAFGVWNGYDTKDGGREKGRSADSKDSEEKFDSIRKKLTVVFDELAKSKRQEMEV